MKRRMLAGLLALLMTALSLAACGESAANTDGAQEPSSAAASPEAEAPAETEEDVNSRLAEKDNLPEADFGGRNFTVIGSTDTYA